MFSFYIVLLFKIFLNASMLNKSDLKFVESTGTVKTLQKSSFNYFSQFEINSNGNSDISNYSEQENSIELNHLSQDLATFKMCLGVPEQCFNMIPDTSSYHLWLPSYNSTGCRTCNHFNKTFSTTFRSLNDTVKLSYETWKLSGAEVSDNFEYKDKSVKLNWVLGYVLQFDEEGADGILGLAREYTTGDDDLHSVNEKFSFLDALYNNKLIDKKVFSLKYHDDEDPNKGKLYLGKYSEEFSSLDKFSFCNVYKSDEYNSRHPLKNLWTCRLSYILIGGNKLEDFKSHSHMVNKRAIFDTGSTYIQGPFSILPILKKAFENFKECKFDTDSLSEIIMIYCKENFDVSVVPSFSFIFNGFGYTITSDKLFKDVIYNGEKSLLFRIRLNKNLDYWILGQSFLMNYHVLFDKERSIIGFNGDRKFITDFTSITDENDFYFSDHLFAFLNLYVWAVGISVVAYFICVKKFKGMYERQDSNNYENLNSLNENLDNTRINL